MCVGNQNASEVNAAELDWFWTEIRFKMWLFFAGDKTDTYLFVFTIQRSRYN